jgi:hypothetical protein
MKGDCLLVTDMQYSTGEGESGSEGLMSIDNRRATKGSLKEQSSN